MKQEIGIEDGYTPYQKDRASFLDKALTAQDYADRIYNASRQDELILHFSSTDKTSAEFKINPHSLFGIKKTISSLYNDLKTDGAEQLAQSVIDQHKNPKKSL